MSRNKQETKVAHMTASKSETTVPVYFCIELFNIIIKKKMLNSVSFTMKIIGRVWM